MKRNTKKTLSKLTALVLCLMVITSQIGFSVVGLGTAAYASVSASEQDSRQIVNDDAKSLNESAAEEVTELETQEDSAGVPVTKAPARIKKDYIAPRRDPFETMRDSDLIFAERARPLLEAATARELTRTGNETETRAADNALRAEIKRALPSASLEGVYLAEDDIDRIELMYADARQDRYIVKYRAVDAEPVSVGEFGVKSSEVMETPDGRLDFITLTSRVNPAELMGVIMRSGGSDRLEFIQPNFTLSYSSFEDPTIATPNEEETAVSDASQDNGDVIIDTPEEQAEAESAATPEGKPDIELTETYEIDAGDINNEVILAIIDTGVDIFHSGLSGYLTDGWNFVDDTDVVYDPSYPMSEAHGTHIAGIIKEAASSAGASIKIMPLKVFGAHGAYTSDIIKAIEFAQARGARIVNCSFGSGEYNPALEDTIAASDMLFVASVGNARSDLAISPVYPAVFRLDNLISVASINSDDGFSYYSNYSDTLVDITARGRDVYSTLPGGKYGILTSRSRVMIMTLWIAGR